MPSMITRYAVDPDITCAETLPGSFYHDPSVHAQLKSAVFARTWQWIGDAADVAAPGTLSPRDLLPGMLDEPLLLARDAGGTLRCLSNVCTHRGNLLVGAPCKADQIRCGYHSRRFDLDGRMTFMPEFREAKNFPSPQDNLPQVPMGLWHGHAFAALQPAMPLDVVMREVLARLPAMPIAQFHADPSRSRDYVIDAKWALYVENYLEGFHIPFVHAGLNQVVDYGTYSTELYRYASLQLALAKDGDSAFDSPAPRDKGKRIAAYYWWIFPNLMLNFYPWGLSLNLVQPEAIDRTRVLFRSYVWDVTKLDQGAGAELDQVEMEDEAIVQAVQRGTRARAYGHGRYSPAREQGTHHFHRLLCEFLGAGLAMPSPGSMMDDAER
jgi:choline monooxygenase